MELARLAFVIASVAEPARIMPGGHSGCTGIFRGVDVGQYIQGGRIVWQTGYMGRWSPFTDDGWWWRCIWH